MHHKSSRRARGGGGTGGDGCPEWDSSVRSKCRCNDPKSRTSSAPRTRVLRPCLGTTWAGSGTPAWMGHLLGPAHLHDALPLTPLAARAGRAGGRSPGRFGSRGVEVGRVVDHLVLNLHEQRVADRELLQQVQPRVVPPVVHGPRPSPPVLSRGGGVALARGATERAGRRV